MMKALEFLKQNRVYEDETIYNSVGEIVGTISQLMEEYAALRQPPVSGRSEQLAAYLQDVIGKKYSIYFEQQDIDGLIDAANCH